MKELMFILLGITIWQLIIFVVVFITNDDEKIFSIGIGIFGWLIYGTIFIFVKLIKYNTDERQAERIVKSARQELKKDTHDWEKWYKHFKNYSSKAWKIARQTEYDLFEMMKKAGFHNEIAHRIIY